MYAFSLAGQPAVQAALPASQADAFQVEGHLRCISVRKEAMWQGLVQLRRHCDNIYDVQRLQCIPSSELYGDKFQ